MTLVNAIYYSCTKYSKFSDVGAERLQLTLFLVGWKTSLSNNKDITNLDWVHGKNGPHSQRLDTLLNSDSRLKISHINFEGVEKKRISLAKIEEVEIDNTLKIIIDDIYEKTVKLNFSDLTALVYSTYPMLVTEKDSSIPMENLAKAFLNQKKQEN